MPARLFRNGSPCRGGGPDHVGYTYCAICGSWPVEGTMLNVLKNVCKNMNVLLARADWNSLDIDYEQPRVERLWLPYGGMYRIYLHRIYPCPHPFYHPHPWPSAVLVVAGQYEMGVGTETTRSATVVLGPGSYYEMVQPEGWHSVKPLGRPSLSVMVTGKPWRNAESPTKRPDVPLKSMEETAIRALLEDFKSAILDDLFWIEDEGFVVAGGGS